ncbi:restriction endonuclease subunit S [Siminovitchia sp. 179-K 8D1 HS]|uniref:restriction endonuclease subunit S n=1 Tax=Siminovitchia sp. 179-K 8D1 HS TaxID=3142385 RepID=UPI0039A114B9
MEIINTEVPNGYMKTKNGIFPSDWEVRKIKDVLIRVRNPVDVQSNEEYKEIGIRSHGKGIFYKETVSGKQLGNKAVFWVEPDCFIVNIVFAWEMAVAKTTKNELGFIASHRFPMYKPKKNMLDLDYITYLFKSPRGKYLLNLASPGGAGRNKTLGQKEFGELEVVIPRNVEEQMKISDILLTWDKVIELKEKLIEQKKEQKKGLMRKLLTGEVRLPGFEGEWKTVRLGQIGKTYNGLSGKSADDFGKGKHYIPYKTIFDDSKIDISRLEYVRVDNHEKQNIVKYGDIFFTTSSETPDEVGMSSVLLDQIDELYLNSFCFGYRLNDFNILLPKFAQFLFRGNDFRSRIFSLAQGSTRFNISKNEVMKIEVSLPSIEEQKSIATILSDSAREIKLLQKQVEFLIEQKKGLMQLLLTGKVRVRV